MNKKVLYIISAIIYIIVLGCVTLPFSTKLIDRIEPHILGLPCLQFFIIASPVIMAIWLIIWFLWECKIENRELEKESNSEEVAS